MHVLLAMDISAAFDAVNHLILCKHIESDFGVTGTALSWLRSFASDRSQYVAVGTWLNEVRDVCFIVRRPTGKCVGALLFAVYVSEIDDVIQSHSVQYHQYADNLMIYLSLVPKAFDDLSSLIGCSDAVSTWFLQNALLLKPAKTEAIIFGTRQRLAGIQTSAGVSVAGTVVHFAEAVELLGVSTLDSALTFNQLMSSVPARTTHALYVISDRCLPLILRSRLLHRLLVQGWTIVIVYCMTPRKATWKEDFSAYRVNLHVLYYRHHGLPVLRTCAVSFIGCQEDNGLFLNGQLT